MNRSINPSGLIFIFSVCLTLISCAEKVEEKAEVLRPVRYQTATNKGGEKIRTFSGVAKAGTETNMSFKVGGTIQRVNVKIGQKVRRGQLITSIDDSDFELQFEEADAAVKAADALEKQAKSNFERVRLLYENENASLSEYESAKASYESAKANEKAGKQRRKLAKSQIEYTRLIAPVSGIIADVYVEENENVSPGQQIVTLNSGSNIEVEIQVPEIYISQIKPGQKVDVAFSSIKEKKFTGSVTEVSFSTSRTETTYPVMIKIDNNDNDIRPGMASDVIFNFGNGETSKTIIVQAFAVGEDREGRYVYKIEPAEDGTALVRRTPVKIGELTPEGIEIREGLSAGDLVVTAGVSKLKDGQKIKM